MDREEFLGKLIEKTMSDDLSWSIFPMDTGIHYWAISSSSHEMSFDVSNDAIPAHLIDMKVRGTVLYSIPLYLVYVLLAEIDSQQLRGKKNTRKKILEELVI